MNCRAEEGGDNGGGGGGWGLSVDFQQDAVSRSLFQSLENQVLFCPSTLYVFGHIDISVHVSYAQMRCSYLFSETGIFTKELVKIMFSFLIPNFLVSLTCWMDTSNLAWAGVGYTVRIACCINCDLVI